MDIIIDTKRQLHPMEDLEDGNFRRKGAKQHTQHFRKNYFDQEQNKGKLSFSFC